MTRAVSLISAAALLIGAAVENSRDGGSESYAAAFLTSGMLVLGVWIAIEVWHHRDVKRDD